jgi:hypothetical protein
VNAKKERYIMNPYMTILQEDFDTAVSIANEEGRKGRRVTITYMPPQTATEKNGRFIITDTTPRTVTEE